MKKKFRVTLAISVGTGAEEKTYAPGQVAELDAETAAAYKHALLPVKEEGE